MKVLIIAPGDSLHAKRWIERLHSHGVSCIFLDMTSEESCHPLPNINVYRTLHGKNHKVIMNLFSHFPLIGKLIEWLWEMVITIKLLRRVILEESPDLINLHWLFHPAANGVAINSKIPIVSTPWGSDLLVPEYQGRGIKSLFRLFHKFAVKNVIKNSEFFCCDAPHMKESLMEMGASEAQIEIIYFGTDVKLFSPNLQDFNIRRHLGFPDNSLLVLSNRQLAEVYDIPTLFYAFAEAVKLDARLRLVIAGGGSLREFLGNLAIELKVENYVHFTGRLSDADFAIATASADIYVSTSPTDGGIAASVAEAMACEVPVIITRFGDNEKWVKEETAGLLFASGDFQELSKCITILAGNPEFRRELGKRGREVILIENNSEIEFLKIIALYEKATTSNSGFPLKDLE